MLTQFTNILRWFTNLNDEKRVIAFMGAAIIFLTFFFIKRDNQNQAQQRELKVEYKRRLDTCEIKNNKYINDKESLQNIIFNLKIDSAVKESSREVENVKVLVDKVKNSEKNIVNKTYRINKKLNKLNKLENEE